MPKEPCIQLSHIFSKLFNSEQYSDMKVVFPRSNHTLHLHQIIICESSEFFKLCLSHEMKELNEGAVVTMGDDDDEELMTELLKACYHFEIEMPSDKSRIVPLVQLAQKYQFSSLLPTLVSYLMRHMDDRSNVLQCLHLDMDNDVNLRRIRDKFELELQSSNSSLGMLAGNAHLTLDFDQFAFVLQSLVHCENKWLASNAVRSWLAFDPENRSSAAHDLFQIVNMAATQRPTEKSVMFDPQCCGSMATLSNNYKRIRKSGGGGWNCAAMGATQCKEFSIRLVQCCSNLMVGVAPKQQQNASSSSSSSSSSCFNKDGNNLRTCGWYLLCSNGTLFSQNGDNQKQYLGKYQSCDRDGTVIGVKLNNKGELSFTVNGMDKGVAFRGLPIDGLFPAFALGANNCEFEFV